MSQLLSVVAMVSCVDFVLGASLVLLTSANCGDHAVLTCSSVNCDLGYRFSRNGAFIYTNDGPVNGTDPGKYSGVVISTSQVQLNITNIQLSDSTTYVCSCGFDESSATQTLQYQCKATTSTATILPGKKLSITVDHLYPQPSHVITSLALQSSPSTELEGTYMCGSSSILASHYGCTWVSTSSLPDGNYGYIITVTTGIETASVNGSFRIVTPTSPTISNLVTISTNRQVLRGIEDIPLTFQCVSSGGIPAPTLAWYRGSTSSLPVAQTNTSDSVQQSYGTYTVTLTHTFTPQRADDLTTFLCRMFYPGATGRTSPNPSPTTALMYLDLKPDKAEVSQSSEAVSGESMILRCTSTNGRPAPSITWSYLGQTFNPAYNLSSYTTSETYTVVSVLHKPVSAVDNGQTATCSVLHTTLSVPLTETINVDVKFSPSSGSTTISGNLATAATGDAQIRLNCTSGSSNPASNITWYNGSDVISNAVGNKKWVGDNNGVITSNILTITPTRFMDGDRITCRADNSYGSDSKYVDLAILYSPLIQPLLNIASTEGEPDVSLTCLASSKPPATFTWKKGNTVLTNGTGTITKNSISYMIRRVDRSYAGNYLCQAGNSVGGSDIKSMYLIVNYPPTVTVSTTTFPFYTVTCIAEGYPDKYTYQDWVQIWPGYGPVATIPFTGKILTLTDSTYVRSGVYVCSASNGIAAYGTDLKYMKGNATVVVKAPPVLTDPYPDGARITTAGKLGNDAFIEIKYWSNTGESFVRCYKRVGDSRSLSSTCAVMKTVTEVILPVYNHMVEETGMLAAIRIPIIREEDLSDYDIVVTNSVQGETVLGITVIPEGPPSTPTITNLTFVDEQVTLTVVPGFHGELNQTIVVQTSTDQTTWRNNSSVNVGKDLGHTTLTVSSLRPNNLHYVRAYAFNADGQSQNYSAVLFIAVKQEIGYDASSIGSTVAVSVSTSVFTTIIVGVVIIVIISRRIPALAMRIIRHSCPNERNPETFHKVAEPSYESLTVSGRQVVYSTLAAAAERGTMYQNLEKQ